MSELAIPRAFWWKRIHSLTGLALSLYVAFHLFTNSQAALWIGDDGRNFIESVNKIHETPYLLAVEFAILALPIAIHTFFGLYFLKTGEMNSFGYDGKRPYLPEYGRNHAYTWQRITSWLLLFGIIFHVVHMRFIEQPKGIFGGGKEHYLVRVTKDEGLLTFLARLNVPVFGEKEKGAFPLEMFFPPLEVTLAKDKNVLEQREREKYAFQRILKETPLQETEMVAITPDFGTAELLMVREAFKSFPLMIFYTVFVLAACFHAFNGLWTFLISWGITLTETSQRFALYISTAIMFFVCFLGLISIYGTYWINLRQ